MKSVYLDLASLLNRALERAFQMLSGGESLHCAFVRHEKLHFLGFKQCRTNASAQQYSVARNHGGWLSLARF